MPPGSWSHLGVQGKCIKPHGADEIDVSSLVKYRAGQRSHAREYHWHFTFKARSSFFFFSFLYLKFDKEEIFHAKLREDAWPWLWNSDDFPPTWEYMISWFLVIHSPACLERTCTTWNSQVRHSFINSILLTGGRFQTYICVLIWKIRERTRQGNQSSISKQGSAGRSLTKTCPNVAINPNIYLFVQLRLHMTLSRKTFCWR